MRLTGARQFGRVFEQPERFKSKELVILVRSNGLTEARLGLGISRKHVRRAVRRNRVKRIIRESFRHHQDELAGLDVVVLTRAGLAAGDLRDLAIVLNAQWSDVLRRQVQDDSLVPTTERRKCP